MQLCVSPPAACHTLPPSTFRPCTTWIVHRVGAPEESAYVGTIGAESGEGALAVARKLYPDGGWSFHVEAQAEARAHQAALDALVDWDPVPYAFHEAGHAMVAGNFGWRPDGVSIRPKRHWRNCHFEPGAVSMGRVIFYEKVGSTYLGSTVPRGRGQPEWWSGFWLAGATAEYRQRPDRTQWENEPDVEAAAPYFDGAVQRTPNSRSETVFEEMKKRARGLVNVCWRDIKTLAERLVEEREIIRCEPGKQSRQRKARK